MARYAMNMQANLVERSQKPDHNLGDVALASDDSIHVYCRASEAVTGTCTLDTNTYLLTDAAGNFTADAAFAANDYGWVRQTEKVAK